MGITDGKGFVPAFVLGLTTDLSIKAIIGLVGGGVGVSILSGLVWYFSEIAAASPWWRLAFGVVFVLIFIVLWIIVFLWVANAPPSPSPSPPQSEPADTRSPTARRAQDEPANRLEWVTCSNCAHSFQVSVPSNASSVELVAIDLRMDHLVEYRCPCPSCGARWWVQAMVLFH